MVETAVILTVGTVLIMLALIGVTRWIVPKALAEEQLDEEPETETTAERPSNARRAA